MSRHFNLYFLLSEDFQANQMDPSSKDRIQRNLENFYKELKPPWNANSQNIMGQENIVEEDGS